MVQKESMVQKERHPAIKTVGQWPIVLAGAMVLATGAVSAYSLSKVWLASQSAKVAIPKSAPVIIKVTGLGRLEPEGEVISLSAPSALEASRVTQLMVKEGDKVRKGQVVAILDSYETRLSTLEQAKEDVKLSQAQLAKVKAGAQAGDIGAQKAAIARLEAQLRGEVAAQQATIARLQAQLSNAEVEHQRYQDLYREGAVSASMNDTKRLPVDTYQKQIEEAKATLTRTVETLQKQIQEAKSTLSRIMEVRPVDVQVAQAQVDKAIAAVKKAQSDLNLTYVRAPKDCQILKIHSKLGQIVDEKGIADLGQTDQMYAVAEIYETDIGKVHKGQRATITSDAFLQKLQGTVDHIGLQVKKQTAFNPNPLADTDQKVVEVKIRLDRPVGGQQLATLTNLQVRVAIHL